MPCYSNLCYLHRGNNLTVKSTQTPQGMRSWDCGTSLLILCRLLALLMALVAAPTVVFAQEGDHDQSKANDPTGAWLVKSSGGDVGPEVAVLVTYHKDGTAAADVQGDVTGFPDPIFSSPEHGVWKKTGAKTFTRHLFRCYTIAIIACLGTLKCG
jgi:hypothetical protein